MSLFFNRCHVDITCIVLVDLSYLYMLTWQPKQFWMLQSNFDSNIWYCCVLIFAFFFFGLYVGCSSDSTIPNSLKIINYIPSTKQLISFMLVFEDILCTKNHIWTQIFFASVEKYFETLWNFDYGISLI